MRTQVKEPELVTCVVPPPMEQGASLWVISCDCVLVELHGEFSITYASQTHYIVVESWHDVQILGKL